MKNFDYVQIIEPVTVSGSYKATDGNHYDVQVISPGITRITGLTQVSVDQFLIECENQKWLEQQNAKTK